MDGNTRTNSRTSEILTEARRCWTLRADALGLKGKARDRACLEWLAGMRIGLLFSDGLLDDPSATTPLDAPMRVVAFSGHRYFENGDYSTYLKLSSDNTSNPM